MAGNLVFQDWRYYRSQGVVLDYWRTQLSGGGRGLCLDRWDARSLRGPAVSSVLNIGYNDCGMFAFLLPAVWVRAGCVAGGAFVLSREIATD